MSEIDPTLMIKIEVALARIEERQISVAKDIATLQREADHRHANIKQSMDAFVPRREIESSFVKVYEKIDGTSKRLDDLEADRKRVLWSIAWSWVSIIVGIGSMVLKKVGML